MKQISCCCFFVVVCFELSSSFKQVNQAVFLNPQTNATFIRCPLEYFVPSLDIQWDEPFNRNEPFNRGRYYRIAHLQPFQREMICFSRFAADERIHLNIRIYDRPLPIPYFVFANITQTTLTVVWKDDLYNQHANITSYQLNLKYSHLIQSRTSVNRTIAQHTFSSLHPNTNYSIDIVAIDIWNRFSSKKTISNRTLAFNTNQEIFSNQLIENHVLDQSIHCYHLNEKYLLIDWNASKFHRFDQIYNLTIFDQFDEVLFTTNFYRSFLYAMETVRIKYQIQLIVSTHQLEYLGRIRKSCEKFFPSYSPWICSVQMLNAKKFDLSIHRQWNKSIRNLQSIDIFYLKNQRFSNHIHSINQVFTDQITDVHEKNYSVIVENVFSNEKFNISIPCSIIPKDFRHSSINDQLLFLIIIAIVLLLIVCPAVIIYRKLRGSISQPTSIPFDQFPAYVSKMHENNHRGFKQLSQMIDKSTAKRMINNYENIDGYIVVQDPMINTKAKFWRMIWDEDVRVVIMIIDRKESEMMDEYIEMFGNIEVTLVGKTSFAYYLQRVFSIRCMINENLIKHEHFVYQFQYTNWPEDGLPLSFLSLIRHSAMLHSQIHTPIVIHSSRDISRIGTFIIIDTIFKALPQSSSIDIPSVIKRTELIPTVEQLMFVYDILLEVIQGLRMDSNSIEKQFQSIVENRKQVFKPFTGPTYLHGYYQVDQFLITKHPLKDQRENFWTLIWHNRSDTIVSLYGDENIDSDVYDYWPLSNEIIDCEKFSVRLVDEHFECDYIYRDCLLQSNEDKDEFHVQIISCSFWPDACSPIETALHLINTIKSFNSQKSILVHDQSGGYRAGIFCALYTMNEQIGNAKTFNVYELAKFYDLQRPGIWHDSSDLLFLYRCEEILV